MKNKETINRLTPCCLVMFSKKTGKISKTLTTECGYAMLQLYGLQNTTKTKNSLIFTRDTGLLLTGYTGTASGMPEVEFFENNENIEDIAPGLLDTVQVLETFTE